MLKLSNISYKADGQHILRGIDMTFENGLIYAITGPNGSGKSTLAKIIAGIHQPSSGSIHLEGVCLDQMDVTERAQQFIAYSFQNPVLFKGITVADLLDLGLKNSPCRLTKAQLLHHVGLSSFDYLDRPIDSTLSGGEMKRIEIASVLARQAMVSIFDEPEAGIDLWSFHRMVESFTEIFQKTAGTFILISHQERLLEMADRIIFMRNGQIESVEEHLDMARVKEGFDA